MGEGGACDSRKACDAVQRLPMGRVLVKSTIAPGTTDFLIKATGKQICFSPEYVGESSYYQPFWAHGSRGVPFVLLGGEPALRRSFIGLLLPRLGPPTVHLQDTALEAQII